MMDYENLIELHQAIDCAGLDAMEKFRIKTLLTHLEYIHDVGGLDVAEKEVISVVVLGMKSKQFRRGKKA